MFPALTYWTVVGLIRTFKPDGVTVYASGAEQEDPLPPFTPEQDQLNGPDPDTADAVPEAHRLTVGAELTETPFALPHAPLTSSGAVQDAFEPPFVPAHVQLKGPVPDTFEGTPVLQRLAVGALNTATLLAVPQAPLV